MTRTELTHLIRKLHRRRKLIAEARELEDRLMAYLAGHNRTEASIPGLKATLIDGEIIITETPLTDDRQLNLLADYFCLEHERRSIGTHQ
jgi:hypothetical protein